MRNIFTESELNSSLTISNLENYFDHFEKFIKTSTSLITKKHSTGTNIEDIQNNLIMIDFMNQGGFETFDKFLTLISQHKVNNVTAKKLKTDQIETISFVYKTLFNFPGKKSEIEIFVSRNFFDSVLNIFYSDCVIHHSHVTGKIIGFAHNFCNQEVRENKRTISVMAHNLFRFDFSFVM